MSWIIERAQEAHTWEGVGLFLLIVALVWLKAPGMAMSALDARASRIQAQLDEATKLREEAERLLADIKVQREATERQAAEMLANARIDAGRLAAEAKVKLEEQIRRRGEMAERRIALAESQAAAEVKAAAADLAAQAAEAVLAARLAAAKSDPLVDSAVAQVATKLQ
ncbi:MAG TPA: ATP F0F1 synthase subunit B [Caulobacteraceae bacterium]|jgi:F-type H+-transporting ATPase subunit b|nr:ATP F0F1 synthase subunit B [Caulobacteraceae bacterium]